MAENVLESKEISEFQDVLDNNLVNTEKTSNKSLNIITADQTLDIEGNNSPSALNEDCNVIIEEDEYKNSTKKKSKHKSRSHHNSSSSGSQKSSKENCSSKRSSENRSRSTSPHSNSNGSASIGAGFIINKTSTTPGSRSSCSSSMHKSNSNVSSNAAQDTGTVQDYTEFSSTGATFELGTPIDAIASVESLTEPSFIYGLSTSQVISGSPLLDALGQDKSFSSSSWRSREEPGVQRAKKTSWYNALYPSYKSRSEDFKKTFSNLPSGERLIVEYSCAIQKDILVHGRLYATVNYLCFYANIFRWETSVALKWKDVNGLTKEKTALVIPNAIQVTTDTDKHFFTSFAARDKTYMMLFKLWQNALLEQPASSADIWRWVHSVYGDELGLTSEDEPDYVSPFLTPEGSDPTSKVGSVNCSPPSSKKGTPGVHHHLHSTMSVPANLRDAGEDLNPDSFVKRSLMAQINSVNEESGCAAPLNDDLSDGGPHSLIHAISAPSSVTEDLLAHPIRKKSKHLSDLSDNSEDSELHSGHQLHHHLSISQIFGNSTDQIEIPDIELTLDKWRSTQEGRELTNEVYPINVDQLFTLLFTNSKFYRDFHANRKTFDMSQTQWSGKTDNGGEKYREMSYTISLTHPMGPKHSSTNETQVMHAESHPGRQYIVDCEVVNGGIPYADSFYINVHFYVSRVSDNESRLNVMAAIKYKKTVWGLVKTFIEKNTWSGLEDFYSNLAEALHVEISATKSKSGKSRRKIKKNNKSVPMSNGIRNGNISNDDVDDETEDNSASLGVSKQIHTNSSQLTTQIRQSGTSALNDTLVKFILILLCGLLLANSVLFYKMWDLEAKLGTPLTNLEEVLISASKDKGGMEKANLIKILQRQEAAHQIELQKWHDLLGTAAGLLKQTEESLTNLQKSIHPMTLTKLQGLLDLQPENELKDDEIDNSDQLTKSSTTPDRM